MVSKCRVALTLLRFEQSCAGGDHQEVRAVVGVRTPATFAQASNLVRDLRQDSGRARQRLCPWIQGEATSVDRSCWPQRGVIDSGEQAPVAEH